MDFDWATLDDLRASWLDGTAGTADYWKTDALLRGYDATFARRIAWKWQWVLADLDRLAHGGCPQRRSNLMKPVQTFTTTATFVLALSGQPARHTRHVPWQHALPDPRLSRCGLSR